MVPTSFMGQFTRGFLSAQDLSDPRPYPGRPRGASVYNSIGCLVWFLSFVFSLVWVLLVNVAHFDNEWIGKIATTTCIPPLNLNAILVPPNNRSNSIVPPCWNIYDSSLGKSTTIKPFRRNFSGCCVHFARSEDNNKMVYIRRRRRPHARPANSRNGMRAVSVHRTL